MHKHTGQLWGGHRTGDTGGEGCCLSTPWDEGPTPAWAEGAAGLMSLAEVLGSSSLLWGKSISRPVTVVFV